MITKFIQFKSYADHDDFKNSVESLDDNTKSHITHGEYAPVSIIKNCSEDVYNKIQFLLKNHKTYNDEQFQLFADDLFKDEWLDVELD
jgi:hypothetical protein